jgi:hypothetical protein
MQYEGLAPLLKVLRSSNSSVQYNAAFALYELSEQQEHGLAMSRAGALQALAAASNTVQVRQDEAL